MFNQQQGAIQQPQQFNNGFYNPYFAAMQQMQGMPMYNAPTQQMQNMQPQQPVNQAQAVEARGEIVWVNGLEEVESIQLQPSSVVVLFDKNTEGVYYIRTRSEIGQYQTRVFKSTEITNGNPSNVDMSKYVTREELEDIISKIGGQENAKQPVQSVKQNNTAPTVFSA